MKIADLKPIKSLDQHNAYKFQGVFENTKQEDKQVLEAAAKTQLQRLSITWSSPLSDHAKVMASNQYTLPALTYLMWTQTWPIANIQQLDREWRKSPQGIDSDTLHVQETKWKVTQAICKPRQQAIQSTVSKERWQGKLIKKRWDDERVKLEECFAWLSSWKNVPSIPSLEYKSFTKDCQLPRFTTTEKQNHKSLLKNVAYAGIPWRMRCSTFYLAVYSALAQTKYQQKHINAFKIVFFEVLRSLDLITKVEPQFSQVTPKPLYKNEHATPSGSSHYSLTQLK